MNFKPDNLISIPYSELLLASNPPLTTQPYIVATIVIYAIILIVYSFKSTPVWENYLAIETNKTYNIEIKYRNSIPLIMTTSSLACLILIIRMRNISEFAFIHQALVTVLLITLVNSAVLDYYTKYTDVLPLIPMCILGGIWFIYYIVKDYKITLFVDDLSIFYVAFTLILFALIKMYSIKTGNSGMGEADFYVLLAQSLILNDKYIFILILESILFILRYAFHYLIKKDLTEDRYFGLVPDLALGTVIYFLLL